MQDFMRVTIFYYNWLDCIDQSLITNFDLKHTKGKMSRTLLNHVLYIHQHIHLIQSVSAFIWLNMSITIFQTTKMHDLMSKIRLFFKKIIFLYVQNKNITGQQKQKYFLLVLSNKQKCQYKLSSHLQKCI